MDKSEVSNEHKLTLFLLCAIFGMFAVHRLYTGKYLTASLQLLNLGFTALLIVAKIKVLPAFSLLVFFLWWIIDFMRIIMGKFTDREGKPIVDWV
jgi:TM2 domain-containing membrane protein YozV